tara:strand:+ start:634 stop:1134 length:501 start_codon:yes stop_codon:yes gene_type:complete
MNRRTFLTAASAAAAAALITLPGNPQNNMRTVETFRNSAWEQISWHDLKKGTVFRLINPDGSLADEGNEHEVCVAMTDAQPDEDPRAVWRVQVEPFTQVDMNHPLAAQTVVLKDGIPVGSVTRLDMRTLEAWQRVPKTMPVKKALVEFDRVEVWILESTKGIVGNV